MSIVYTFIFYWWAETHAFQSDLRLTSNINFPIRRETNYLIASSQLPKFKDLGDTSPQTPLDHQEIPVSYPVGIQLSTVIGSNFMLARACVRNTHPMQTFKQHDCAI